MDSVATVMAATGSGGRGAERKPAIMPSLNFSKK